MIKLYSMLKISLVSIFWLICFEQKMIGMLCFRHTPIEFVKIEMNCYSGLCVSISDYPQPVTCQLRSN